MNYLTKKEFLERTNANKCKNWSKSHLQGRWIYHHDVISLLKNISPNKILEMGSLGVTLSDASDTLDYDGVDDKAISGVWPVFGKLDFNHDLRVFPWPIDDKVYDVVVALRVFQHLDPVQIKCFSEVKRISNSFIMGIPNTIKKDKILSWADNAQPNIVVESGFKTDLYYWKF